MKRVALIFVVVVLAVGLAYAKDYEITKKAGDYTVQVRIDKNPPIVGKNNVLIEIRDKSGKTVSDAKVSLDYGMPAMPGMPAMNYKADAMPHGNTYHATMNLSMSGSWNIAVKISRAGKMASAKFSIDAR